MRQIGKVEQVSGTSATVVVMRQSMCGEHCASCKGGCTPTRQRVSAQNTAGAIPGDMVVLELRDAKVLAGAALVYLVPLAALFAGYLIAALITESEGIRILSALLCTAAVFLPAKWADTLLKKAGKYQITISKVLQ